MSATPTAHELCLLLERSLRGLGEEARVQATIEALLKREGIEHKREHRFDKASRIDFLIGSIGVEVKTGGGISAVIRQLHRYAEFATVSELVLVTTRATLARTPRELNGKRVHVALLLAGIV